MANYRFLTTWVVAAPIEPVFDAIHANETWPRWWKGVEEVEREVAGDALGVGALDRFVWKSRLPYRLEFRMRITRVERPRLLEGQAVGELEGEGRWRLFENSDGTAVVYEWSVRTAERWMNLLAPVARPFFAWNHDVVMRQGGEGLAKLLGVPLLVSD